MTLPNPKVPHIDGHGFDPAVCHDCEHLEGTLVKRCGLCGCPTGRAFPMYRRQSPPETCPLLDRHAQDDLND